MDKLALSKDGWNLNVKNLCESLGFQADWESNSCVNIKVAKQKLLSMYRDAWREDVQTKIKLNNFSMLNENMETSPHLHSYLSKVKRSLVSQIQLGCLPLEIEAARFTNTSRKNRICRLCDSNSVEDELHFIFCCTKTNDMRTELYRKIPELLQVADLRLRFKLLNEKPYIFSDYLYKL